MDFLPIASQESFLLFRFVFQLNHRIVGDRHL